METTKQFYDISKFPPERGIIFFLISLSRISNSQSAESYSEYMNHLFNKIDRTQGIGVTFLYGDYLYLLTADQSAHELRSRYLALMTQHRNAILKLLESDSQWVSDYFTFKTYGQALVDFSVNFQGEWQRVYDLYKKDAVLQKCVAYDSKQKSSSSQTQFILEEALFFCIVKKQVHSFENPIINHREEWVLDAYPGKPLLTEAYLMQKNFFKYQENENRYQNHQYNLEENKLYDLTAIDIEKTLASTG